MVGYCYTFLNLVLPTFLHLPRLIAIVGYT